jgi:membrane-bound lytic murein transglycosylase D
MAEGRFFAGPLLALLLAMPGTNRALAAEGVKKEGTTSAKAPAKGAQASETQAEKPSPAPKLKPTEAAAAAKATPGKSASPVPKAAAATKPQPKPTTSAKKVPAVADLPEAPGSLPALEAPDSRVGQGTRKITPPAPAAKPAAEPEAPAPGSKEKAPKRPLATLPPGQPKKAPDAVTRRQIATGPTDDDVRAGKDDPELSKLREAERVLFPRPLAGFAAGWSWEAPAAGSTDTEVVNSGVPPELPLTPPAAPTAAKDADWLRGLALPNLPLRYDDRILKYLKFYRDSPNGKAIARVWAKKSGRYQATLRAALTQAGLPTDLVYLSLIESGHNPLIASPVGAVGLWQFMPETARTYGLTVDRWVDERLDPARSTDAAVRFLADLYRRFGSWELSMAAYNMGHGGLSRAIKKFNSNDFWELARHEAGIPWETTLYVPKILATAILMNNKKAFAIDGIEPEPPESFDVLQVGPGIALADVARATGLTSDEVERMNPMYLAGRTPPVAAGRVSPSFPVRVPRGIKLPAGRLLSTETGRDELVPYAVRRGDTPAAIARASGASETTVRSVNRIGNQETLSAGTILLVPRARPGSATAANSRDDDVVVVARQIVAPRGSVRVFYPVATGDTLGSVALAFGVPRSDVLAWNALDASARLQDGMVLQLFPKATHDLARLRTLREPNVRVLVAGSPQFFDHFEGLNGKRRLVVKVKEGDTLASIGRRYETSVGWMERINRRSRADRLVSGESIVVYADRARHPAPAGAAAKAVAAQPLTPAQTSALPFVFAKTGANDTAPEANATEDRETEADSSERAVP